MSRVREVGRGIILPLLLFLFLLLFFLSSRSQALVQTRVVLLAGNVIYSNIFVSATIIAAFFDEEGCGRPSHVYDLSCFRAVLMSL